MQSTVVRYSHDRDWSNGKMYPFPKALMSGRPPLRQSPPHSHLNLRRARGSGRPHERTDAPSSHSSKEDNNRQLFFKFVGFGTMAVAVTRHRSSCHDDDDDAKSEAVVSSPLLSAFSTELNDDEAVKEEMYSPAAVVSQEEETDRSFSDNVQRWPGRKEKEDRPSLPPRSTLDSFHHVLASESKVPASPLRQSPRLCRRHSIGCVDSAARQHAMIQRDKVAAPSPPLRKPLQSLEGTEGGIDQTGSSLSSRRSIRTRRSLLPPLARPPLKAGITQGAKTVATAQTPLNKAGINNDPTINPSDNSIRLHLVLGKQPFKADETLLKITSETRPRWEGRNDENQIMEQTLMPTLVTATPPCSSLPTTQRNPFVPSTASSEQKENNVQTGPPSSTTDFSLDQLNHRVMLLFPQVAVGGAIFSKNFIAPRLFACFSLHRDAAVKETMSYTNTARVNTRPSPRKRPRRQSAFASNKQDSIALIQPILQFLSALVDLEIALLQGDSTRVKATPAESKLTSTSARRRVHFAAFDGSALQPPSDVMENSHSHQQAAIDGWSRVIQAVESMKETQTQHSIDESFSGTSAPCNARELLHILVVYLEGPFVSSHAALCAQSLSNRSMEFPLPRVEKVAKRYAEDLKQLLVDSWWRNGSTATTGEGLCRPLSWHHQLADASAQLVRYWLRTELNPVPNRAPSEKYSPDWNNRVCDLVTLEAPSLESSTAVDDGSLSSLVSNAASHISHYFGNEWQKWKGLVDATPTDFFGSTSKLCLQGIAPGSSFGRRKSGHLLKEWTLQDWQRVSHQVEVATGFLAAVNGAKFLYDLLTVVVQYPEFQRSWERTIRKSAEQLSNCGYPMSLQEQDVHLVLLRYSPNTLLQQLPVLINWTRKEACEHYIEQVPKLFLFGSDVKKTRRKRAYQPHVGILEFAFEQAMSKVAFPTVHLSEREDDED